MSIAKFTVPVLAALAILLAYVFVAKSPEMVTDGVVATAVSDARQSVATISLGGRGEKNSENKMPIAEVAPSPFAELVQQKYSIVFSSLQLSPQTREALQTLLQEREAIAARSFYDAGSNSAEVEENLRQRELAIAEQDERIAQLLTADDAKKYALLKDSSYEQALLNGFYQVAGMDNVAQEQKLNILLGKLEQKQKLTALLTSANDQITNAAPATKSFLIEKTHQAFIAGQQEFLRNAKNGLSEEQFQLLQNYEQQLADERWGELVVGWE